MKTSRKKKEKAKTDTSKFQILEISGTKYINDRLKNICRKP